LLWKYKRGVNVRAFKGQKEVSAFLKTLESDEKRSDWLIHQYHDNGWCNEILDDGGYWNHSDTPNTGGGADLWSSYAIRDIKKGEELLDDYGMYEWPSWLQKLCVKYGVDLSYFTPKKASTSA
jgi:hypothetical protein